jgi:Protein of unknown function (DUF4236)
MDAWAPWSTVTVFWRKSVKIAPGVVATLSERGASVSAGPEHAKVGVNSSARKRASLSWGGFSWRKSRR